MALTDREIKNLRSTGQDQFIADGSGLYLRAMKSGGKVFVYRSRKGGKARWIVLGPYPQLSLLEARKQALEMSGKALPGEVLVREVYESWKRRIEKDYKRPELSTLRVELHLPPLFGRKVASVTRAELASLLDRVASKAPTQANRLLTDVKAIFNHAVERGWIESSPAALITAKSVGGRERSRDRVLNEKELGVLVQCLLTDRFAPKTRLALALCLLTGQRSGEVRGIAQNQVQVQKRNTTWQLPAQLTKNGLAHDVSAGSLFDFLIQLAFREFGPKPFEGMEPQVLSRAMARMKFEPNATPHDLRRSMATHMSNLGVQPHVVERCLNHKLPGVAGIYNRAEYAAEKAAAWRVWSRYLLTLRPKRRPQGGA